MKWDVIRNAVFARKTRSAWGHAVKMYALDIIDKILAWEYEADAFVRANAAGREKMMLSGAASWEAASYGGSFLIDDEKIAFRCCNPTEYEHKKQGARKPNKRESWLDVQARALGQAARMIDGVADRVRK